jgi:dihydroorotase
MNIEIIVIENGRVIDPKNGVDRNTSLFIADGKVAGLGEAPAGFTAEQTIDATAASSAPA